MIQRIYRALCRLKWRPWVFYLKDKHYYELKEEVHRQQMVEWLFARNDGIENFIVFGVAMRRIKDRAVKQDTTELLEGD